MAKTRDKNEFLGGEISKTLIVINTLFAVVYFLVLTFFFPIGNKVLFGLLVFGEVFHLWQLATFLYTVWERKCSHVFDAHYHPTVDIFITVAGEPTALVAETLDAVQGMSYEGTYNIYVLNDGYVAGKENWSDIEQLGARYGVTVITRKIGGGAKAGNINHALQYTHGAYVVIFDADHVPHHDFLQKTIGYFVDKKVAFVQSPQYYKNYAVNDITAGAWEQQEIFFGPICEGKDRVNAATMCGTNMVIRREALLAVGGMCEASIAEDFATGMFMHRLGWQSVYVSEVLAEGLAPEDFLSYYKQQHRWTRGALDVVFKYNVIFGRGLTFAQRIQYLSSVSFFFSGIIVVMNAVIPLIYFFTGVVPFFISTMLLATVFLPYIFITLYTLQAATNFSFSYRALAFSMSSFSIHCNALWSALIGKKETFEVTSKSKLKGNFLGLVRPHLVYIGVAIIGICYAWYRSGLTASLAANTAWAVLNAVIFSEFVFVAMPESNVKRSVDRSRKAAATIISRPIKAFEKI